ncbi:hypothetical protein [Aureimonas populi]|uniref:Uncharacterized protein n=1 Tax=Aureimonas populi TaxID=1701758 RepID=A0ABW5CKU8_9HYPH|nr:hypothetical protein [Aureimonas populi]
MRIALPSSMAISPPQLEFGIPLVTSRNTHVDSDFRSFLLEYADSGVFERRSEEARIIRIVARHGLTGLTFAQREIWYARILSTVSKPMSEQIAISMIVRNGGRVPRRIDSASLTDDSHPFALAQDIDIDRELAGHDRSGTEPLVRIARALRAKSGLSDGPPLGSRSPQGD